jgi:hypothetical protein
MSTDFRPLTPIRMEDLFDGRLEDVGVYEHHSKDATSHNRCLTDGVNFLWVHSNEEGLVSTFTRWAPPPLMIASGAAFDRRRRVSLSICGSKSEVPRRRLGSY